MPQSLVFFFAFVQAEHSYQQSPCYVQPQCLSYRAQLPLGESHPREVPKSSTRLQKGYSDTARKNQKNYWRWKDSPVLLGSVQKKRRRLIYWTWASAVWRVAGSIYFSVCILVKAHLVRPSTARLFQRCLHNVSGKDRHSGNMAIIQWKRHIDIHRHRFPGDDTDLWRGALKKKIGSWSYTPGHRGASGKCSSGSKRRLWRSFQMVGDDSLRRKRWHGRFVLWRAGRIASFKSISWWRRGVNNIFAELGSLDGRRWYFCSLFGYRLLPFSFFRTLFLHDFSRHIWELWFWCPVHW